mmetsp:Transcript_17212/g.26086  ORF Transcript_17212/g.26086 Transcript_17212/m.26086 type:complete len:584 (+) Transcript_17212:174-1925(+)
MAESEDHGAEVTVLESEEEVGSQSSLDESSNSSNTREGATNSHTAEKKELQDFEESSNTDLSRLKKALEEANEKLEQESSLRRQAEQELCATREKLQEGDQALEANEDDSSGKRNSFRELFTEKKLAEAAAENSSLMLELEGMQSQLATLEKEMEETRYNLENERTLRQEAERNVEQTQSASNKEGTNANVASSLSAEAAVSNETNELETTRLKLESVELELSQSVTQLRETEKSLVSMGEDYQKCQQLLALRESELEEKRLELELDRERFTEDSSEYIQQEVRRLKDALSAREEELKVKSYQLEQAAVEQHKIVEKCMEAEEDLLLMRAEYEQLEKVVSLRESELEEERLNLKRAKDDSGGVAFVSLKEEYREVREVLNSREKELREKHIKLEEAIENKAESDEQLREAEDAFFALEEDYNKSQDLLALRESELEEARLELELERALLEETRLELQLKQKPPDSSGVETQSTDSTSTLSKLTEENISEEDDCESNMNVAFENDSAELSSNESSPSDISAEVISAEDISAEDISPPEISHPEISELSQPEISSDESSCDEGDQFEELVDQDGFPIIQKKKIQK